MTLNELIGEHILDGVDFEQGQVKTYGDVYEPCQVMRFRMDGVVYAVYEDPEDGYRSAMKEILVSFEANFRPEAMAVNSEGEKPSFKGTVGELSRVVEDMKGDR